jgi:hypothetical protein
VEKKRDAVQPPGIQVLGSRHSAVIEAHAILGLAWPADHRWVLPLWVAYYSTGRAWRLWERLIGWVGLVPFATPEGDAVCSHYLVLGATGSGKGASAGAARRGAAGMTLTNGRKC